MVTLWPSAAAAPPADRRAAFLIRAGQVLASSLDYEATLQNVVALAVPELADRCAVHLREDQAIRTVAMRMADPSGEPLAREWQSGFTARLEDNWEVGRVIREGKGVHFFDIAPETYPELVPSGATEILAKIGLTSLIVVPVVLPSGTVGAISLSMGGSSGRRFTDEDLALAEDLARRAGAAIENARLHREARQQAARAAFLAEASRCLAASLDPSATMPAVMALAVPSIADWGIVYLRRADGGLDRAAFRHSDPELQRVFDELHRRWPQGPRVAGPLERVIRYGESVLVDSEQHKLAAEGAIDDEHRAMTLRLGLGLVLLVPLMARGNSLGALVLVQSTSQRAFAPEDIRLAEEFGLRAGAAFENALVHDRLAKLQRITSLLSRPSNAPEVAKILVTEAARLAGATTGAISLLDDAGRSIDLAAAHPSLDALRPAFARVPVEADLPLAYAVRAGDDVFVPSPAVLRQDWIGAGGFDLPGQAWAVLALRGAERTIGALWLGFEGPREFDADTRAFLRSIADQGAQALARSRLAEAALVRQQLLESQNESTLDAIFFQDADRRPAFFNQRLLDVFGVPREVAGLLRLEDRLARSLDAVADPTALGEIALRMEREPMATLRFDLPLKDGRVLDAYTAPVTAPDGARLGRAWYYRDVTQQRRVQAQLFEARQQLAHREKLAAMGTLVSGVAHEIRTPLAYAANHAHLLTGAADRAQGPDSERIRESAASILEAVERIDRLVQDLRRFTKLGGSDDMSSDLAEATQAAARLFEATHPGRVRLHVVTPEPSTAFVPVERVQLQQVVLNLLENAADCSPSGERVDVRAATENGTALIEVRDRGHGIPAHVQARMWEPFFTTKKDGTGLGLSIVRRILESHGGSVACESAVGQGATFRVRLPLTGRP